MKKVMALYLLWLLGAALYCLGIYINVMIGSDIRLNISLEHEIGLTIVTLLTIVCFFDMKGRIYIIGLMELIILSAYANSISFRFVETICNSLQGVQALGSAVIVVSMVLLINFTILCSPKNID